MSFTEPLNNFTVYSKSGCINCRKVKELLTEKKQEFTIIDCDEYLLFENDNFLSFINTLVGFEHKTFPIVFYDSKYVGGLTETSKLLLHGFIVHLNLNGDKIERSIQQTRDINTEDQLR